MRVALRHDTSLPSTCQARTRARARHTDSRASRGFPTLLSLPGTYHLALLTPSSNARLATRQHHTQCINSHCRARARRSCARSAADNADRPAPKGPRRPKHDALREFGCLAQRLPALTQKSSAAVPGHRRVAAMRMPPRAQECEHTATRPAWHGTAAQTIHEPAVSRPAAARPPTCSQVKPPSRHMA